MVIKIAHRGYCNNANSNTLQSIQDAIDNNFDMIELDIQLDKDNKIILHHDTYYKNNRINTLSYKELKAEQPYITLLSTLFKEIDYKKIKLYFDLKGCDKVAYELHSLFIKMNIDTTNIWMASFNLKHIEILRNKNKDYKLGLITANNYTLDILSFIISKFNIIFVAFDWEILHDYSVRYLQNRRVQVFVYTIDTNTILNFIEPYNVDGIVTDILL